MKTKSQLGILTIAACLSLQTHAQSFLTNGLVAYYPFQGNANDASGNGNNGTIYGATFTSNRFGLANSALSFNGTSSYMEVPWSSSFNATNITISLWTEVADYTVQTDPLDPIRALFIGQSLGTPVLGVGNSNTIIALSNWGGNTNWDLVTTGTPVPLNDYQFLVGCFTPTNLTIYQNGIIAAQGILAHSPLHTCINAPFYIGGGSIPSGSCAGPFSGEFLNGTIDEIRIYNRILSTNEVQQLYAYGSQTVISLKMAVQPSFSNLYLSSNYQLQVSTDLNTWTNQGAPFTPTNTVMDYPQYFDVDYWNQLFFRLQVTP